MKNTISKSSYQQSFFFQIALLEQYRRVPIKLLVSVSYIWKVLPERDPVRRYGVENWKSIKVTSKNL